MLEIRLSNDPALTEVGAEFVGNIELLEPEDAVSSLGYGAAHG
jgi:hypothetical protein